MLFLHQLGKRLTSTVAIPFMLHGLKKASYLYLFGNHTARVQLVARPAEHAQCGCRTDTDTTLS